MVKISDAELEVMKIVWKRKRTTSVEIIEDLKGNVSWNINTIRTLIKRLLEKGAIKVVKMDGKKYMYEATVLEREYKVETIRYLLKKMYNGSIEELVVQYCEDEKLSVDEMKVLTEKINEVISKKK